MNRAVLLLLCFIFCVYGCSNNQPRPKILADFETLEPQALISHPLFEASVTDEQRFNAKAMIKRYQSILDIHDDPQVIAKVERRIADLKMQAAEDDDFAQAVDESQNNIAATTTENSKVDYADVIRHYQKIINNNPHDNANEQSLYQLAKAYDHQAQAQESLATLNQLIAQFPNSDYRNEIQFRRADIYYSRQEYAQANKLYASLTVGQTDTEEKKLKAGAFYLNALYMQGWSEFKLANYVKASEKFSLVLDITLGSQALENVEAKHKAIVDDSLRILAVIFSYQNYGQSIAALYKKIGAREYEALLYEQLTTLLLTRGLNRQALETNNTFIEYYPFHNKSPEFFATNIKIHQRNKDVLALNQAKDEYIKHFGVNSAYWQQASIAQQKQLKLSLHIYLLEMASLHHGVAQALQAKNKGQTNKRILSEYNLAIDHYLQWLMLFPEHQEQGEKSFLLAQAYVESNHINEAIFWYQQSAYDSPAHQYDEQAAYALCINYQTLIQQKNSTAVDEIRQLSLIKVRAQQLFSWYFPHSKHLADININTLESYYKIKEYDNTIFQSQQLLASKTTLSNPQIIQALTLQGHSYTIQSDYLAAEKAYKQAIVSSSNSATQQQLKQRLASSVYKQAEYALEKQQMTFALLNFHRLPYVSDIAEYRMKAHFDEATYLLISQRYQEAINSLLEFRLRYPTHALQRQIRTKLIAAYEGAEQWGSAAEELLITSKAADNYEQRRLALYLSAEYYAKAGLHDKALSHYRSYAHQFPKPFDLNLETKFKLSQSYKKKNDVNKREYWLRSLIEAEKKQSTLRSQHLAAMASRYFADKHYTEYAGIELSQPLEQSISLKQKAFEKQLSLYKKIDDYSSETYSAYARFSIAALYADLSQALLHSERPANFNALELEEYQYMLEDEANPFEEKAIEIHTMNSELSQQGIFNSWVKKSFEALESLYPARFHRPTRLIIDNDRIH